MTDSNMSSMAAAAVDSPSAASPMALLRAIEGEVIPRLILAHRGVPGARPAPTDPRREATAPARLGARDIVELAQQVLRGETAAALRELQRLHALGLSSETLYLDLLAPVARHLGELWEADSADFVAVTVALQRLQKLAQTLSEADGANAMAVARAGRRGLCVPLPGEQHAFGAQLVCECLRRAGWDIWDAPGADEAEILALVRAQWFALVGVSISTEAQLEPLAALVRRIRKASNNPDVRIMVGGLPFVGHPERVVQTGADATAVDGREAVAHAEHLLELLSHRN